jgi:hypothetical protein
LNDGDENDDECYLEDFSAVSREVEDLYNDAENICFTNTIEESAVEDNRCLSGDEDEINFNDHYISDPIENLTINLGIK